MIQSLLSEGCGWSVMGVEYLSSCTGRMSINQIHT